MIDDWIRKERFKLECEMKKSELFSNSNVCIDMHAEMDGWMYGWIINR